MEKIMEKLQNAIGNKFSMFTKGYEESNDGKHASFYDEENQPMEISAMEYYSNGKTLVLGQKNGQITFVDSQTFEKKYELRQNTMTDSVTASKGGWDQAAQGLIDSL